MEKKMSERKIDNDNDDCKEENKQSDIIYDDVDIILDDSSMVCSFEISNKLRICILKIIFRRMKNIVKKRQRMKNIVKKRKKNQDLKNTNGKHSND